MPSTRKNEQYGVRPIVGYDVYGGNPTFGGMKKMTMIGNQIIRLQSARRLAPN